MVTSPLLNFAAAPINDREAYIRSQAIAAGKDPNLAVAEAKSKGLLATSTPQQGAVDTTDYMKSLNAQQPDTRSLITKLTGMDTSGLNYGGVPFSDRLMGLSSVIGHLANPNSPDQSPAIMQAGRQEGRQELAARQTLEQKRQLAAYIQKTNNPQLYQALVSGMDPGEIIKMDTGQKFDLEKMGQQQQNALELAGVQNTNAMKLAEAQQKWQYQYDPSVRKTELENERWGQLAKAFGIDVPGAGTQQTIPATTQPRPPMPPDQAQPVPQPLDTVTPASEPPQQPPMPSPQRQMPGDVFTPQMPRTAASVFPPPPPPVTRQGPQPQPQPQPQQPAPIPLPAATETPLPTVSPATQALRESLQIPWLTNADAFDFTAGYIKGDPGGAMEKIQQRHLDELKAQQDAIRSIPQNTSVIDTSDPSKPPREIYKTGAGEQPQSAEVRDAQWFRLHPEDEAEAIKLNKSKTQQPLSSDEAARLEAKKTYMGQSGPYADHIQSAGEAAQIAPALNILGKLTDVADQGLNVDAWVANNVPGYSSAADLWKAQTSFIAPRLRVKGTGSQSNLDIGMLLTALPSLTNTKEGNKAIVAIMKQQYQAALDMADADSAYVNGDISWSELQKKQSAIRSKDFLKDVPDNIRKDIEGVLDKAGGGAGSIPQSAIDRGFTQKDYDVMTSEERKQFERK